MSAASLGSLMETPLEIGTCPEHLRENEAFCIACRVNICANCAMFGVHQGHSVLKPRQAAAFLREQIDLLNKKGKLTPEYSGKILKEITEVKEETARNGETVVTTVHSLFDQLISALKTRKTALKRAVQQEFSKELARLQEDEQKWEEKQETSRKLTEFSECPEDDLILRECSVIMESVDSLNEAIEFKAHQFLREINIHLDQVPLEYSQLVSALGLIGEFGENKLIQHRS